MYSIDPNSPLHLWYQITQQAGMELNMLCTERTNPKISAYELLEGQFGYNRSPLELPGSKVIIHGKPQQLKSWAPHGNQAWNIGPALEHYLCYMVYIPETHGECVSDKVDPPVPILKILSNHPPIGP